MRAAIKVKGDVSGQIAVGNNISQKMRHDSTPVTDSERAELHALLSELRAHVAAAAPPEQVDGALERIDELAESVTAAEPEIGTVRYVLRWFRRNIPALAGTVQKLVLNPLLSRIVGAAGDVAAADFEQFLHDIAT
ncbi:hypothetical protein [uncultured Pseudonocardia sp.]|uniref:hypothetical protein n=1 Tax=uncultured Pseudonocardia sp. TaxID=211455 RepID=UPI002607DF77|nr:hypothetical protein [uncultured Pseudonocardia sp.]